MNFPIPKHPRTYLEKFHNILQHHPNHLYVFMDVSKGNYKTACTAVLNETILKKVIDLALTSFRRVYMRNLSYSQTHALFYYH